MVGKKLLLAAIALSFMAGTGCCRLCERWCHGHDNRCAPTCCTPVQQCCPAPQQCCPQPSYAAPPLAQPVPGWQR